MNKTKIDEARARNRGPVVVHIACRHNPGVVCESGKRCPGGLAVCYGWDAKEDQRRRALPLAPDAATGLWRKIVGGKEAET